MKNLKIKKISHREKLFLLIFAISALFFFFIAMPFTVHAEEDLSNEEIIETPIEETEILDTMTDDDTVSDGDSILEDDSTLPLSDTEYIVSPTDLTVLEEYIVIISEDISTLSETVGRLEVLLMSIGIIVAGVLTYTFVYRSLSKKGVL